jgi:hypothetical protein
MYLACSAVITGDEKYKWSDEEDCMLLCIVVLNDRISEIIRLGISRGYCHRQLQSLLEKGFRSRSYRSNFDVVLF